MSMLSADAGEERGSNPLVRIVVKFLVLLRSSFLVFLITFGVLMFALGFFIGSNAVAAILGILGVSLVLFGLLGFGILALIGYR